MDLFGKTLRSNLILYFIAVMIFKFILFMAFLAIGFVQGGIRGAVVGTVFGWVFFGGIRELNHKLIETPDENVGAEDARRN